MRIFRNLIIPIIILLILGVFVFLLLTYSKPKEVVTPVEQPKAIYVLSAKEENIKSASILSDNYDLEFKQNDIGLLQLVKPNFEISYDMLSSIVYEFSNITATKIVMDNAISLNQFGLENHPKILKIIMKDNTTKEFLFGKPALDRSGIYFIDANNKKTVYLMDPSKYAIIFSEPVALNNLTLFTSTQDSLSGIKLEKYGKLEFEIKISSKSDWRMSAPYKAAIRNILVDDLYKLFETVNAESYVDGKLKPLSEYGLATPKYTLTLINKTNKKVIEIGAKNPNGLYYGKMNDSKEVFLIKPENISLIEMPTTDLIMKFINLQDITNVKKLKLEIDGKTDTIDIQNTDINGSSDEKYLFDGVDVTGLRDESATPLLKNLYESIISVSWYELDLVSKPKLGKVDLTMSFELNDGTSYKIQLSKKNEVYYYAYIDGEYAGYVVNKDQLEPIRLARAALIKEAKRKLLF